MKGRLFFAIAVISIGSGFQHGYNIGVLNAPQEVIENWIRSLGYSDNLGIVWSTIVSIYCVGGVVGGLLTGTISEKFGRNRGLMFNNVFAFLPGIILAFSKEIKSVYTLVICRFILGINSGLNAGIAPMYLSEISSISQRGSVSSTYQLMITVSILIAQVLGIKEILGSPELWPYLLGLTTIPAILQFICLFFVPESPKHTLAKKGNEEKALKDLKKLARQEEIVPRISEIKTEIESYRSQVEHRYSNFFKKNKLRKPLIIVCCLMVGQQFAGINAVIFYSTHIFKTFHLSVLSSQFSTLGVGGVNIIATIASVFLIEKFGRKKLLIISFVGIIITTFVLFCILYFAVSSTASSGAEIAIVYLYIIFFAIGAGTVPWVLSPELFDSAHRALAVGFSSATNWFSAFIVGLEFLIIQEKIGSLVFLEFLLCQVLSLIFIVIYVPETKNKPIDEITALFG